ncbi:MAG: hypothetical protein LBU12_08340 [Deltaproteobacteria bacterium]|jgi:3-deoxy-D-manno-octulosonic-acid transferase|nr:hypothetical protein [Deltaproteobacteria bacterium]
MRTLYTVVYAAAFCLASPYWLIRGLFSRAYLKNLRSRFIGPGRILPKRSGRPRVWVWAMSLGEVLSARELVRELAGSGADVIVTATTLAGLAMARAVWPKLPVLPSPLDFSLSTRRFIALVEPDALILVETDIWPGVLWAMKRRGLATALVSARLSPRSFKNYRRIRFFWGRVLRLFDRVAVQTEEDRAKFVVLGAEPSHVAVTGNLKFDQPVDVLQAADRRGLLDESGWPDGRWLVAGSTHLGEETVILRAFQDLLPKYPDLKLLVAPRDRHKFALTYREILEFFPHETARRSAPAPTDAQAKVFLLDTLGELERWYALAETALIGKSWPGAHEGGGHNPLEAAVRGRPVLSGPRVHNFKWIYQGLTEAGGALLVDRNGLTDALDRLLADPATADEMGRKGREFVETHRGAVSATLKFVAPLVPQR